MITLVVNCGSSSIKYVLIESETEKVLARGVVERIGEAEPSFKHEADGAVVKGLCEAPDHEAAFHKMLGLLLSPEHGVISSPDEIHAVGHRVVHGGESFMESVLINDEVKRHIQENAALAPLHNPPNLMGIEAAQHVFPDVPHTAVFDTAFHQHMPAHAYLYAVPYRLYEEHGIRRYGFHGTSHLYVAQRAAEMLEKPYGDFRVITCHLGNGCSMAAVRNGHSVDTSMGLTPLEGLVMGTRCGDIDPAVVLHIQGLLGLAPREVDELLNKQSGVLGVSEISNDMRALREAAEQGNERAALARSIFAYRVRKYIGAYLAVLGGADAIVFTGGIGEKDPAIRAEALQGLDALGIVFDEEANKETFGKEGVITRRDSPVAALVIPTNEELIIARDAARLAGE